MIFKYGPIEGIKLKGLPGSMGWKEKLSGSWSGGSCPAQKFGTSFSKHRHRSQFVGYLPMVIPDNWSSHPPWFPFGFGPPVGGAQTTGPSQHLQALRCLEQLDHYDTMMASWKALSMDWFEGKSTGNLQMFTTSGTWRIQSGQRIARSRTSLEILVAWVWIPTRNQLRCQKNEPSLVTHTNLSGTNRSIDPLRKSLRMMTTFSWSWRLGSRGGFEFTCLARSKHPATWVRKIFTSEDTYSAGFPPFFSKPPILPFTRQGNQWNLAISMENPNWIWWFPLLNFPIDQVQFLWWKNHQN